ncbi:uncharacterized protein VTP21DRAFT_5093 [Calcarisporiella thermophila]|uniref:uncharacterized protein n=1 Tax=Calcarisporiella thermophila TaxID=911321 RepID=UPI0037423900
MVLYGCIGCEEDGGSREVSVSNKILAWASGVGGVPLAALFAETVGRVDVALGAPPRGQEGAGTSGHGGAMGSGMAKWMAIRIAMEREGREKGESQNGTRNANVPPPSISAALVTGAASYTSGACNPTGCPATLSKRPSCFGQLLPPPQFAAGRKIEPGRGAGPGTTLSRARAARRFSRRRAQGVGKKVLSSKLSHAEGGNKVAPSRFCDSEGRVNSQSAHEIQAYLRSVWVWPVLKRARPNYVRMRGRGASPGQFAIRSFHLEANLPGLQRRLVAPPAPLPTSLPGLDGATPDYGNVQTGLALRRLSQLFATAKR